MAHVCTSFVLFGERRECHGPRFRRRSKKKERKEGVLSPVVCVRKSASLARFRDFFLRVFDALINCFFFGTLFVTNSCVVLDPNKKKGDPKNLA